MEHNQEVKEGTRTVSYSAESPEWPILAGEEDDLIEIWMMRDLVRQ